MTAQTLARPVAARSFGRFAGLKPLVRKDLTEWLRGRRGVIVLAVTSLFMVLTAANAWITTQIANALPPDVDPPDLPTSLAPLDNLMLAIGSQIFVLAAIFAVASLIVRERESGTLAWVASKPVTRDAIWVSKWVSAGAMLALAAVLVPVAITTVAVVALYGVPDMLPVAIVAAGGVATVVFFATVGLAAGTVMPGQPAIAATGFIVFAVAPMVAGLIPLPIGPVLPTSILAWSVGVASGADVGWVTPVAWLLWTAGLGALAIARMRRLEL